MVCELRFAQLGFSYSSRVGTVYQARALLALLLFVSHRHRPPWFSPVTIGTRMNYVAKRFGFKWTQYSWNPRVRLSGIPTRLSPTPQPVVQFDVESAGSAASRVYVCNHEGVG